MNAQWPSYALEELCEFRNGLWKGEKHPFETAHVLRNTNFRRDGVLDYSDVALLEVEQKQLASRRLNAGDIVLEKSGGGPKQPVGRVAYFDRVEGVYSYSNFTAAIRVKNPNALAPRFLLHVLNFFYVTGVTEPMQKHSTGIRNLNFNQYKALQIPLPPLDEQKRIVAILDEAFAGIDKAIANTERNLANAKDLFESYLNSVFANPGEDWEERRLADIVTRLTNGYVGPTRNIYLPRGIPYLLARHVRDNKLNFDGKTFISPEFNQRNKKSMLLKDDVLLVQSGHIGHAAVVTAEHEGHNCHAMIVLTPRNDILRGEFLSLYFLSPEMKSAFEAIRSGSTVPHLTCGEVRELTIKLPPISGQIQIIDEVQKFQGQTTGMINLLAKKMVNLKELKQSILQKAFTGELTAKGDAPLDSAPKTETRSGSREARETRSLSGVEVTGQTQEVGV